MKDRAGTTFPMVHLNHLMLLMGHAPSPGFHTAGEVTKDAVLCYVSLGTATEKQVICEHVSVAQQDKREDRLSHSLTQGHRSCN